MQIRLRPSRRLISGKTADALTTQQETRSLILVAGIEIGCQGANSGDSATPGPRAFSDSTQDFQGVLVLIAYLDEVGETGAYISHDHERFNTSAAFGYAGFVIPDEQARNFGSRFTRKKRQLFRERIAASKEFGLDEGTWEIKGSEFFHKRMHLENVERLRVFDSLIRSLLGMDGAVFYYADEKERGTPKQTSLDKTRREESAMMETLNRLARHAEAYGENMLVILDQVNEKERKPRAHRMYGHVYRRGQEFGEMKRILEAPMHLDSEISASIQFADWIAAAVGRAIDYQLEEQSEFSWIPNAVPSFSPQRKAFTYESKLHLFEKVVDDINNSQLFCSDRPVYPSHHSQYIDPTVGAKMMQIAYSTRNKKRREGSL